MKKVNNIGPTIYGLIGEAYKQRQGFIHDKCRQSNSSQPYRLLNKFDNSIFSFPYVFELFYLIYKFKILTNIRVYTPV